MENRCYGTPCDLLSPAADPCRDHPHLAHTRIPSDGNESYHLLNVHRLFFSQIKNPNILELLIVMELLAPNSQPIGPQYVIRFLDFPGHKFARYMIRSVSESSLTSTSALSMLHHPSYPIGGIQVGQHSIPSRPLSSNRRVG